MKKRAQNPVIYYYDVKLQHGSFLPPFLGTNDDEALNAVADIAKTVPSFQRAYVRCIGSYDVDLGDFITCTPRILKMKKEKTDKVQNKMKKEKTDEVQN